MQTKTVIDQMGREIIVPKNPKRIISLVPSQTELLFDLGLTDEVVGITKFCIHPNDRFSTTQKIGGTKNFRLEEIDRLKPDLIIGNKEENYQEGIEELERKYPVWMSDIYTISDALEMIREISHLVGKAEVGEQLLKEIEHSLVEIKGLFQQKAVYFIWRNPFMVAGTDTFIHQMMQHLGIENLITDERYPELSEAALKSLNPDLILLSSEPYPFQEKHLEEFHRICPNATIKIVDGEAFSWYGSRLKKNTAYFKSELSL